MNEQSGTFPHNQSERQQCSKDEEHCPTCSDQAQPAKVLSVDHARGLALVEIAQTTAEIDVSLIEDVEPGDTLLVHDGVALSLWL
jgi:hypothetical protein